MNAAQQKIADLEKRHADERARLDKELAILKTIPDDLAAVPLMVHPHKLYDRIGSIHFQFERYESLRKPGQVQPTIETAIRAAEVYPPVPLAIFRDSCVSVRTQAHAEKQLDANEARGLSGTITTIAPFWLEFHPASHSQYCEINFIGQSSEGLIEITTRLPLYSEWARKVAQVAITWAKRSRYGEERETRQIESKRLDVNAAVHVLGNAKAAYLSFADSNDRREPGNLYLYWDTCGDVDGDVPTLQDLAAAVAAAGSTLKAADRGR